MLFFIFPGPHIAHVPSFIPTLNVSPGLNCLSQCPSFMYNNVKQYLNICIGFFPFCEALKIVEYSYESKHKG